jgi:nitroreductase
MTNTNMSLFDAIHSQRAIRHFSVQPVSDEALETMLHAAIRAPSGGNRQPWRFRVMRGRAQASARPVGPRGVAGGDRRHGGDVRVRVCSEKLSKSLDTILRAELRLLLR